MLAWRRNRERALTKIMKVKLKQSRTLKKKNTGLESQYRRQMNKSYDKFLFVRFICALNWDTRGLKILFR